MIRLGRDTGWRSLTVSLPVWPGWRVVLLWQIGGPSPYTGRYWYRREITLHPV